MQILFFGKILLNYDVLVKEFRKKRSFIKKPFLVKFG